MAGTKEGGIKLVETMLARDPDYYKKLGAMSGGIPKQGTYFAKNPDKASQMGQLGAIKSLATRRANRDRKLAEAAVRGSDG